MSRNPVTPLLSRRPWTAAHPSHWPQQQHEGSGSPTEDDSKLPAGVAGSIEGISFFRRRTAISLTIRLR